MKKLGMFVLILFVLSFLITFFALPEETVIDMVEVAGMWGPIVLFIYFVLSQVVAPLSGTAVMLIAMAMYGGLSFIVMYLASAVSAAINFWISRKLGRKWVAKLGGENILERIDRMKDRTEIELLVMGRLIGFPIFDVISYAAGFTTIPFKKYYFLTLICNIFPLLGFYMLYVTIGINFLSIAIMLGILVVFSIIFALWVEKMPPRGFEPRTST